MNSNEYYFFLVGAILSFSIALLVMQHNKVHGFSHKRTFVFAFLGLMGLVFILWKYFWDKA